MGIRTFLATFGATLLVLALAAPVPLAAPHLASGPAPSRGSLQCLSLAYEREIGPEWFPRRIRLSADPSWLRVSGRRSYGASTDSAHWWYRQPWWRPVAGDSLEIAWHDSPVIRLPTSGDTLVGHALPTGVWSVVELALFARSYAVRAIRMPCQ